MCINMIFKGSAFLKHFTTMGTFKSFWITRSRNGLDFDFVYPFEMGMHSRCVVI